MTSQTVNRYLLLILIVVPILINPATIYLLPIDRLFSVKNIYFILSFDILSVLLVSFLIIRKSRFLYSILIGTFLISIIIMSLNIYGIIASPFNIDNNYHLDVIDSFASRLAEPFEDHISYDDVIDSVQYRHKDTDSTFMRGSSPMYIIG